MMTEEEIARLFDRAVSNLDWPGLDTAISGAQREARLVRRRRRVSLVAGGALAAGMAGVVVAVAAGGLPQVLGSTSSPGPVSASASPSQSATTPSPTPSQSIGPPTTGPQILATLKTLLPPGFTISNVRPLQSDGGSLWLELDYNNGQGAVDFSVVISPPGTDPGFESCSDIQKGYAPGILTGPLNCTMSTLPDGSKEVDLLTPPATGFYDLEVMVLKPDGYEIELSVADGNLDTPGQDTVTQPKPPGSFAQWSAVADSPAWHL
jgi:hypothetical protein